MTMKRTAIKPISKKRQKQLREYIKLSTLLKDYAGHKSELSGKPETQYDKLVPHHIEGREGKRLINPFNIIICLTSEHTSSNECIHKHNSFELKQELLKIVEPIRLNQGFKKEDYV
jgi:hypothetical protein